MYFAPSTRKVDRSSIARARESQVQREKHVPSLAERRANIRSKRQRQLLKPQTFRKTGAASHGSKDSSPDGSQQLSSTSTSLPSGNEHSSDETFQPSSASEHSSRIWRQTPRAGPQISRKQHDSYLRGNSRDQGHIDGQPGSESPIPSVELPVNSMPSSRSPSTGLLTPPSTSLKRPASVFLEGLEDEGRRGPRFRPLSSHILDVLSHTPNQPSSPSRYRPNVHSRGGIRAGGPSHQHSQARSHTGHSPNQNRGSAFSSSTAARRTHPREDISPANSQSPLHLQDQLHAAPATLSNQPEASTHRKSPRRQQAKPSWLQEFSDQLGTTLQERMRAEINALSDSFQSNSERTRGQLDSFQQTTKEDITQCMEVMEQSFGNGIGKLSAELAFVQQAVPTEDSLKASLHQLRHHLSADRSREFDTTRIELRKDRRIDMHQWGSSMRIGIEKDLEVHQQSTFEKINEVSEELQSFRDDVPTKESFREGLNILREYLSEDRSREFDSTRAELRKDRRVDMYQWGISMWAKIKGDLETSHASTVRVVADLREHIQEAFHTAFEGDREGRDVTLGRLQTDLTNLLEVSECTTKSDDERFQYFHELLKHLKTNDGPAALQKIQEDLTYLLDVSERTTRLDAQNIQYLRESLEHLKTDYGPAALQNIQEDLTNLLDMSDRTTKLDAENIQYLHESLDHLKTNHSPAALQKIQEDLANLLDVSDRATKSDAEHFQYLHESLEDLKTNQGTAALGRIQEDLTKVLTDLKTDRTTLLENGHLQSLQKELEQLAGNVRTENRKALEQIQDELTNLLDALTADSATPLETERIQMLLKAIDELANTIKTEDGAAITRLQTQLSQVLEDTKTDRIRISRESIVQLRGDIKNDTATAWTAERQHLLDALIADRNTGVESKLQEFKAEHDASTAEVKNAFMGYLNQIQNAVTLTTTSLEQLRNRSDWVTKQAEKANQRTKPDQGFVERASRLESYVNQFMPHVSNAGGDLSSPSESSVTMDGGSVRSEGSEPPSQHSLDESTNTL